jgi:hypothetical protein
MRKENKGERCDKSARSRVFVYFAYFAFHARYNGPGGTLHRARFSGLLARARFTVP